MPQTEGISLNLEWIGTESVNEPQMEVSSGSYKLDRLFYFMGGNYGRWTDAGMSDKIYEVLKEIASYQNSKECSGTEIGVQFKKKSGFMHMPSGWRLYCRTRQRKNLPIPGSRCSLN